MKALGKQKFVIDFDVLVSLYATQLYLSAHAVCKYMLV